MKAKKSRLTPLERKMLNKKQKRLLEKRLQPPVKRKPKRKVRRRVLTPLEKEFVKKDWAGV